MISSSFGSYAGGKICLAPVMVFQSGDSFGPRIEMEKEKESARDQHQEEEENCCMIFFKKKKKETSSLQHPSSHHANISINQRIECAKA